MATIAQNLETLDTAFSTMKTNLNLPADASLSDVVSATSGGGGADLSEYFNDPLPNGNSQNYYLANYLVKKVPDNITLNSNVTSLNYAFSNMRALKTAPIMDTSNVRYFKYMFNSCDNLENVPVYDTSSANENTPSLEYMFSNCNKLTNTSLDNILQMCIAVSPNVSGRNLARLGLSSTYYPAATIQALPHYSDFTSAGWSIGY